MIFDTNLLRAEHQADHWLRRGIVLIIVVASVFGTSLVASLLEQRSEVAAVDKKLAELGERMASAEQEYEHRIGNLPDGISQSLKALSALPTYSGHGTASLLYQLEKRLPREIHLSRLRHDRRKGEVMLEARTRGGDSVPELLQDLGKIDGARGVRMLGQESADDGSTVVRISFDQVKKDDVAAQ